MYIKGVCIYIYTDRWKDGVFQSQVFKQSKLITSAFYDGMVRLIYGWIKQAVNLRTNSFCGLKLIIITNMVT